MGPISAYSKGEGSENSRNTNSQQDNAFQAPLAVENGAGSVASDHTKNENGDRFKKSLLDWSQIFSAIALVVIGGLQLYVFGLQAKRLRETIEKMDEVAKEASRIGQAQVRAYISLHDVKVSMAEVRQNEKHLCDIPIYTINVSNTGNSPILKLRYFCTTLYMGQGDYSQFYGGDPVRDRWGMNVPVGRGIEIEHKAISARLRGKDINVFQSGDLQVIATFHVTFRDVFDCKITQDFSFRGWFPKDELRTECLMDEWQVSAEDMAASYAAIHAEQSDKQTPSA